MTDSTHQVIKTLRDGAVYGMAIIFAFALVWPDPVPATEVEYVSAPNIPGPPLRTLTVPTVNLGTRVIEPLLGIETTMRKTNYVESTFEPIGCQLCERVHHHRVIESYTVTESSVVPALVGGERRLLSVGTARTNLAMIYTTNYVEHPAAYPQQTRGVRMAYPPLPPAPELIYQQNRSNYLRKMDPTRGAVKPNDNSGVIVFQDSVDVSSNGVILAKFPRRSNTSTFVPP